MSTWILLRAAGIGAYLMLYLSVLWGLVATTRIGSSRVSKQSAIAVHGFLGSVGLALLGVHIGGILADTYVPFSLRDVLIPGVSAYRPVAIWFGVVAMYAVVAVVVSSWMRRRLQSAVWRRIHLLAVPAFIMALVHGAFAGSDGGRSWMWWMYVCTGASLVFLLVVRATAVRPSRARARAAVSAQSS